jgi:hypothetical protein
VIVTKEPDNSIQDIAAKALQLTAVAGLDAACQLIEAGGNPIDAALAYREFSQALYRQNKNVQHMIDAGQRGIEFALDHAARAKSDDAETAAALTKMAKIISFNVGANTWPGWGDDGISISPDQRAAGIDAATLSLRLANELMLGPPQMAASHWLVAAHHIAARRPDAALAALDEAARGFAAAGDNPSQMMVRGYRALARKLCVETRATALTELDRVLECLEQDASKPARFYQQQLVVADKILCADPS